VSVERAGDTFRVTWTSVANLRRQFTVTYRSGNQTGLAIYGAKVTIGKRLDLYRRQGDRRRGLDSPLKQKLERDS
jgi:hypothetical protein